MGIAARSSRTPFARGTVPAAVDTAHTPSTGRWRIGRAYRAGRLVCGCVHVTVSLDERLGLTARERRMVRVRFHEPVDDERRCSGSGWCMHDGDHATLRDACAYVEAHQPA